MAFFKWEDKYLVGFETIDNQHKHLVDILNELYDGLVNGTTNDIIETTLDSLVDYTIYHFNGEEALFKKNNYPDYLAHKKMHDDLTGQVLEIQKNVKSKSATLTYEMMDFLRDWLMQHTLSSDQDYAKYFRNNNIKI